MGTLITAAESVPIISDQESLFLRSMSYQISKRTNMEIEQNPKSLSSGNHVALSKQVLPVVSAPSQSATKEEGGLDVGQLIAIIRRRSLLIGSITAAVASAAVLLTATRTPSYSSKFQLLIEPITAESRVLSSVQGEKQESIPLVDYETQIKVLLSPKLLNPVVEQLQKQYPDFSYGSLASTLEISLPKDAEKGKILEVNYQAENPQKVKAVTTAIANTYLKYSLDERQTNVRQGLRFVDEQLPELQAQVTDLEGQLQKFRQQYDLIDPDTQGQKLTEQIALIQKQRQETQLQLSETQSRYTTLQQQTNLGPQEAIAGSVLSEAPEYQKLLGRLREIESELALKSAQYTEEHPIIQSLRDQRAELVPLLQREAQSTLGPQVASVAQNPTASGFQNSVRLDMTKQLVDSASQIPILQTRVQALAATESSLTQQFKQFPVVARQYGDLQRKIEIASNNLSQFLAKREGLRIEAAQKEIPWELISPPSSPATATTSLPRAFTLGALLGLLLGTSVAFVLDRLSNVIHTPRDVKLLTRLPILGMIPFQKQLQQLSAGTDFVDLAHREVHSLGHPHGDPAYQYIASPFTDAFRSLCKNLRFLRFNRPIRSIVISSAIPGEGKSTVAMHLARAAAAMGQRVLLVDTDLRRPQVHQLLGVANGRGLTEVIHQGLSLKEAVQPAPYDSNLYVLTAGQLPPDPTSLLSSAKMQQLTGLLPKAFNLIIYDAPPLGLADASLLAPHTDGLVLVTRLGVIERGVMLQALEELEVPKAPVLGVVINGVKEFSRSERKLYHSYYQGSPVKALIG
jgi:polysaccharide biosynthesis transport protein